MSETAKRPESLVLEHHAQEQPGEIGQFLAVRFDAGHLDFKAVAVPQIKPEAIKDGQRQAVAVLN